MTPPTKLSRGQRRRASRLALRLLIGVAAGVLAVVACAPSPSPSPSVEPLSGPSSPVSAGASPFAFTGSAEEYIAAVASCLRDAGWNVETDGSADITAEQRPAFMAARESCGATLGELPPSAPLSEVEIRARYAYLLEARDCLIELGYTIGAPATLDHFLDSYASGPWSPFNDLADQTTSQAEWEQANQACPQAPGM